jgi:hypothetical protein
LFRGRGHVVAEIDLDPRNVSDIGHREALGLGQDQVADRLFIFEVASPLRHVLPAALGQGRGGGGGKTEESD